MTFAESKFNVSTLSTTGTYFLARLDLDHLEFSKKTGIRLKNYQGSNYKRTQDYSKSVAIEHEDIHPTKNLLKGEPNRVLTLYAYCGQMSIGGTIEMLPYMEELAKLLDTEIKERTHA